MTSITKEAQMIPPLHLHLARQNPWSCTFGFGWRYHSAVGLDDDSDEVMINVKYKKHGREKVPMHNAQGFEVYICTKEKQSCLFVVYIRCSTSMLN